MSKSQKAGGKGVADGLFTMDFILSIGGSNDSETREMIHVLNMLTSLWGHEAVSHMAKFLNLVKSKTDELAVTLQVAPPPPSSSNSGESSSNVASTDSNVSLPGGGRGGKACPVSDDTPRKMPDCSSSAKAKTLEAEKKALQQRLKETEANLNSAKKEIETLKFNLSKPSQPCGDKGKTKKSTAEESSSSGPEVSGREGAVISGGSGSGGSSSKNLDMLLRAYNNRCIELDTVKDESFRHSIWFAEQNSIYTLNKLKLESKIRELLVELDRKKKGGVSNHNEKDSPSLLSSTGILGAEGGGVSSLSLLLRNMSKVLLFL